MDALQTGKVMEHPTCASKTRSYRTILGYHNILQPFTDPLRLFTKDCQDLQFLVALPRTYSVITRL